VENGKTAEATDEAFPRIVDVSYIQTMRIPLRSGATLILTTPPQRRESSVINEPWRATFGPVAPRWQNHHTHTGSEPNARLGVVAMFDTAA